MEEKNIQEVLKLIEDSIEIAKENGDSQREAELNSLKEKYSARTGQDGQLPQDMVLEAISDMESLQGMLSGMEDVATTKAKKEQIAKSISDVGNIILGARDLATGNRQVRESTASQEAIEPFSPQRRFQRSDELARRIRETRQEGSEAGLEAQVAAQREAIENQFQQDVNAASVASSGQAGAYQALAQVASRNRIRNLLNLNQQKSALRDQNRRNLNYLATQDVAQNQAADVSERARAQLDYRRFSDAQREAGEGIAAGEQNRRTGLFEILNTLPNVISDAYKPGNKIAPRASVSPSPIGIPTPQASPEGRSLSIPKGFNVNDRTGLLMQPEMNFDEPGAFLDFDRALNYRYS